MSRSPIPKLGRQTAHGAVRRPKNELDLLLTRQHSLISRSQALAVGLSDDQIYRLVRSGRWDRPQQAVYGVAGVAYTPERILLGGCLGARGAAMSFARSSGWMWGLLGGRSPESYEIVVGEHQQPRLKGITVHRFADVDRTAPVLRRGVPCTNPLRTVVDLGAVCSIDTVFDAIHRGRRADLFRMSALVAELERVARRGRNGAGVLRDVLDELNVLGGWSASRLEQKARELFRRGGLPEPLCEVRWGAEGEYRLDFFWPGWGVVVEVDGWAFHASDRARGHDLRRQNKLVLGGLAPLRYCWRDIVRDGRRVIREVREHAAKRNAFT